MKKPKLTYEENLELLKKEWSSDNNCDMETYKKTYKAIWKCSNNKCENHIWKATISKRKQFRGCPYCYSSKVCPCLCNSLETNNPELVKEWHPTKNKNLTPKNVIPGSARNIWWICKEKHVWKTEIRTRVNGSKCPYCIGLKGTVVKKVIKDNVVKELSIKINSLADVNPELAKQWHPTLNGELKPEYFLTCSSEKIWWLCNKSLCGKHVWKTNIYSRTNGRNCPYCCNKRICSCGCNSLLVINPELAKQWHPILNGKLNPKEISLGSDRPIWWLCNKSLCGKHVWKTTTKHRKKTNCPYCCNSTVCPCGCNSLLVINPELAKEWHPTKNKELTPKMVTVGSSNKVWWICSKRHEWESTVGGRKRCDCPYCNFSKGESIIEKILTLNNIEFIAQKRVKIDMKKYMRKKCYDIYRENFISIKYKTLSLDFFIPETNYAIEFDGIQHFQSVEHFGGQEMFVKQVLHDKLKSDCCLRNNIKLIRIHYKDMEQIGDILKFCMKKVENGIHQIYSSSYTEEFMHG